MTANTITLVPQPKPLLEQLMDDIDEQRALAGILGDLIQQRADEALVIEVAEFNEALKAKWGGVTPSQWLADARREVQSCLNLKAA